MAKNETQAGRCASTSRRSTRCDIVITAQGGDYTNEVFPKLRAAGWKGHWIDAASTLRMKDDAVIILDPVNMPVIKNALAKGGKNWIGGNCTVSCMLMGVGALFKAGLVEWMSTHDLPGRLGRRRAAHARAAHAVRLAERRGQRAAGRPEVSAILEIDRKLLARQQSLSAAETSNFGVPLGGSLIPWIDKDMGGGVTREEWKGMAETNKILGRGEGFGTPAVPVDGVLRARGRDALPQPGAELQAQEGRAAGRHRSADRGRQRVGEGGAQHSARPRCGSSRRWR